MNSPKSVEKIFNKRISKNEHKTKDSLTTRTWMKAPYDERKALNLWNGVKYKEALTMATLILTSHIIFYI